jgi:hypothetical protein
MRPIATLVALVLAFQLNVSAPSPTNVQNIGGSAVSTAATGVQKVGITGNAGAVFDAATNGAAPANQIWHVATPTTATGAAISASGKATITISVNVKASAGNVYGVYAVNGAASVCWVEFVNSATAGTLGTAVILSIPLPASGVSNVTFPYPVNFSTGIAVGIASAVNGASACGTAGNLTVFFQ